MKIIKYIQGQEVKIDVKITATVNGKPLEIDGYADPLVTCADFSPVFLIWSAEDALKAWEAKR